MRRRILVSLGLVLLAGACNVSQSSGGDQALGSERIERFLERDLPQGEGAVIDVTAVRCPRRVERRDTASYTCSITVEGASVELHVEEEDGRLRRREAVLVVATLEAFVQQQYEAQLGVAVVAECSPEMLIATVPGRAIECTATDAEGTSQTASLQVEDLDGNVTLDLVP